MRFSDRASEALRAVEADGRMRRVRDFDGRGVEGDVEGRPVVTFASNDYLGLSAHPSVVAAGVEALERWGAGAGSARLIVGSRPVHSQLERALADWKSCEEAVLFPNGFAANLGVLTTLGEPDTVIVSDRLNHASIVDGCRMAKARVEIYPHCDVDALTGLLDRTEQAIVITDHVFSMDGDVAPVEDIATACSAHGALLVLDEAHAVITPEPDLGDAEVVRIGTLSKFLGSMGGFVATSGPIARLLINRARPYIFTTATSPADAACALAALRIYLSDEGADLRERLRSHVDKILPGHPSPIIPVVLGDEEAAVKTAAALLERGLLVPAIRPPSVPPGTSRLRITLSAGHTDEHIDALAVALEGLGAMPDA